MTRFLPCIVGALALPIALSPSATAQPARPAPPAAPARPAAPAPKADPELTITKGELRLDGKVTAITGPNTFTLSAISFTAPSGNGREFESPKPKRIVAPASAIVRAPDGPRRFAFKDVKLGARVAVIGKNVGGGVKARVVILLDEQSLKTMRTVTVSRGVAVLADAALKALEGGQTARAAALYQQAARTAKAAGDGQGEGLAFNGLGIALERTNQPQKALEAFMQALRVNRELADVGGQALILLNMSSAQAALGQRDTALISLDQAVKLSRQAGENKLLLSALREFGDALALKAASPGDLMHAASLYTEALPLARESGEASAETDVLLSIALVRAYQGNAEAARQGGADAEKALTRVTDAAERGSLLEGLGVLYAQKAVADETKSHALWQDALKAFQTANLPAAAARVTRRLEGTEVPDQALGAAAPATPPAPGGDTPAAGGDDAPAAGETVPPVSPQPGAG